jgi:hypothetical protein
MSVLTNTVFLKDAAERAIKTFAQTLLSAVGTGAVLPAVTDVDWTQGAAIGATAAIISILTSIVTSGIGNNGTASVVHEVVNVEKNL